MSTQHTPIPLGPLSVSTVTTSCGICHKIGPLPKRHHDGRECYACVYVNYPSGGPVDEAMLRAAHMFAAAPDMYEALKNIDARLRECMAIGPDVSAEDAYDSFYQDIVRAALAKAEDKS